ncbi:MAG: cation diffusion facilitator family transporter, partial [Anaerolineales bacterium]|nr:cation diffusion facilitator family transporter [Anaerolineales bacterium]MDW8448173.1 cation diffusion facilitator family transporter [Anaerolineales bacterium]
KRVNTLMNRASLTKYAWLSIVAALFTITLKTVAFVVTGSVGLLSDALESLVNLVAAIVTLLMLVIAARPADELHNYGHTKAEYFSSLIEGILIFVASIGIILSAIGRILEPRPLERVPLGLLVSVIASLVNLIVAQVLMRVGKKYNAISLEADAHHLMTDVYTSIGVIVAVGAVALSGWHLLDPIIAIVVALNISRTAISLLRRSVYGLMDTALGAEEQQAVLAIFEKYRAQGVQFHALRTRQAAGRRFISFHILVPGRWSTHRSHHLAERVEAEIRNSLAGATVFTHLEPVDDPLSYQDIEIDR